MSQLASERALNIDNENVTIEGNVEKEEAQNSSPVVVQGVKVFSDDFVRFYLKLIGFACITLP